MRKWFLILSILCAPAYAADEQFFGCGEGFVTVSNGKIDGIVSVKCQKLWCRDLETGKPMGADNKPASGYVSTSSPIELRDASGNSVMCFGNRKWCAGETAGVWNPEYGAYTRGGADSASYKSSQKGDCFKWSIQKTECPAGQTAILTNGEYVCATAVGGTGGVKRAPAVRRTATMKTIR